ncbi:MAG: hypothetical protein AAFW65_03025 [Pseudomonadota bacterium]
MIIFRLLSLFFTMCGLAVVITAAWLLMGNKLEIPDSEVFGESPDIVERYLPTEPRREAAAGAAPMASARGFGSSSGAGDEAFSPQMMPAARSAEAAATNVADTMREVPIAYAAPQSAQFARPFDVSIAIDATGDDTAADALPSGSEITEDTALVTERLRASISGSAFNIEALSPEIQKLSSTTENVWRWRVTPREAGEQELAVELFGFDGEDALPIRTYRDTVAVEVTRVGQAIAIAEDANPIAMLLGGIGSVLAGFFGFVGFFRK